MVLPLLAAQAAVTSMDALTGAVKGLKDRFDKAMEIADNAQRQSLSLGKTFEEVRKDLKGTIGGLRGSLETKLGAGFQLLNTGLEKNSAGVARLINQQQLTGTAFTSTAKVFSKLEATVGFNRDASNRVSDTMLLLNQKFGVATDKLVDSLAALKETFTTQKVLGLGGYFQEAVAELTAKYGPAFADSITNSLKYVLEPGLERTVQAQAVGLAQLRNYLQTVGQSETPGKIAATIDAAFKQSGKNILNLVGGDLNLLGIYKQLFGPIESLIDFTNAVARDPKQVGREQAFSDFAKTLDTMRQETFNPLDELLTDKIYPAFLKLYEIYSASINVFFRAYNNYIEVLSQGQELVNSDIFKRLGNSLIDAAEKISFFAADVFIFLTEGGLGLIKKALGLMVDVLEETFKPGGHFDGFTHGLKSIILDIREIMDIGDTTEETEKAREAFTLSQGRLTGINVGLGSVLPYGLTTSLLDLGELKQFYAMGVLSHGSKQYEELIQKYPGALDALESDTFDIFKTAFIEGAKLKEGGQLSKEYDRLMSEMESNSVKTDIKTMIQTMRTNFNANISLLHNISDSTEDTADNTKISADATIQPMQTAMTTNAANVLSQAVDTMSTNVDLSPLSVETLNRLITELKDLNESNKRQENLLKDRLQSLRTSAGARRGN